MWAEADYGEADYERDWHATFFAVRIPGQPGARNAQRAAIHDLYADLVQNDFTGVPMLPTAQFR
jgi:hypothetical protein